jgi:hypothetical protein
VQTVLYIHTLPDLLRLTVTTLYTRIPSTIIYPLDPIHQALAGALQAERIAEVLQPVLDRQPWVQGEEPVVDQVSGLQV